MVPVKKEINIYDYAAVINSAMKHGILLTTKADGKVNTMTIGWGALGIEWSRPVFTAYVRESRYTREMLEKNGEFTINIPMGDCDPQILVYCGRNSGRDGDKIQKLGLTLEEPETISVPGIKELPLTIECKVLYSQLQDCQGMPEDILNRFYPAVKEDGTPDRHIAFYGEIQKAYIIED